MDTTPASPTPSVLFVCVKNGGKSQMAAAIMRHTIGGLVRVHSAGTQPGTRINGLSAQVLAEVGASLEGEYPKAIDPDLLTTMDRVVVLGTDAVVEQADGPQYETWETHEPSLRGIDGIERMRLVRDDQHWFGACATRSGLTRAGWVAWRRRSRTSPGSRGRPVR